MTKSSPLKRKASSLPATSKGKSSDNPDRVASRKATRRGGSLRTKATIKRLQMYRGGKVVKNKKGQVVGGELLDSTKAGGKALTAQSGRIQPDRRWFGNTRTVASGELDKFREEMRTIAADPFKVVVHTKQVPLGLVKSDALYDDEATIKQNAKARAKLKRKELLDSEPFNETFEKGVNRKKRPKLAATDLETLAQKAKERAQVFDGSSGKKKQKTRDDDDGGDGEENNKRETSQEEDDESDSEEDSSSEREGRRHDLFAKGQSKRIWAELYKVVDCSDVVIHVVDARDVPGTTCDRVVSHVKRHAGKSLLFVLNKCDLAPGWAVKRWVAELGKTAPTVAFKATRSKTFGKGSVLDVLKQFAKLLKNKQSISVGIVGYPNVGKSSLVNALRSKNVCKVAPVPGETKVWQFVTLTKKVNLIDSPGVVYDRDRQNDADAVLKGVVRAERLPDPTVFVPTLVKRCHDLRHLHDTYGLRLDLDPEVHEARRKGKKKGKGTYGPDNVAFEGPDAVDDAAEKFLSNLARKMGRLLPGGEPDLRTAAVTLINDWQRGKIPHFVPPPETKGPKRGGEIASSSSPQEEEEEEAAAGENHSAGETSAATEEPPPKEEQQQE